MADYVRKQQQGHMTEEARVKWDPHKVIQEKLKVLASKNAREMFKQIEEQEARELKVKVKMKETLWAVLKEITGDAGVLAKKRKLGESSDEE